MHLVSALLEGKHLLPYLHFFKKLSTPNFHLLKSSSCPDTLGIPYPTVQCLTICGKTRFVGVWNLPLRRADIKKKVKRVADSLTRQFQEAMQKELQESIDMVKADVEALTRPYHKAAEEEVSRISGLKTELQRINAQLQVLRQRVQNLGT